MELALNLVWLLLAALALAGWSRAQDRLRSRSQLIALACMLALLFPVISATDDLHAMRPELEDSTSKRFKHTIATKSSTTQMVHNGPVLATSAFVVLRPGEAFNTPAFAPTRAATSCIPAIQRGRAPPLSAIA